MNKSSLVAALFALLAMTVGTGTAAEQPTEVDGVWQLVAFNEDGKDLVQTVAEKYVITRKDQLQTITKGGAVTDKSKYRIDVAAEPKTITFTDLADGKVTTQAIYIVAGDSLKIAIFSDKSKHATDRPRDFEPAEGKTVATYKKAK